jgi:Flp pilus assembly protein TadD
VNEAVREYKEAIRLKPDFAEAHSNLGVAYKELGDFDSAIREYRIAIRLKPGFQQAHSNLAIAHYFKENYAEAWKEVYECRRLGAAPNPDFLDALSQKMPDPGP